jgi:tRNA threonylcarbamoyl adenosine modification protein (Sua5/YciO/YrdC/YwlC family)
MAVRHIYTFQNPLVEKDIDAACAVLEAGGVIAYPTDLNWAFGCDSASGKAMDKIRMLKPTHPKEQPFSLICDSISMASEYGNIEPATYRVLRRVLPGPYTILLERNRALPRQIKDKRKIVGIRIPNSPLIAGIVKQLGRPMATTSVPFVTAFSADGAAEAPRFGYQIVEAFGHALDLILDLSEELPGTETTIVDFTEGPPRVVRVGAGDPTPFASD